MTLKTQSLIFLLLVTQLAAKAQWFPEFDIFVSGGYGGYYCNSSNGFSWGGDVNIHIGDRVQKCVKLRGIYSQEFNVFGPRPREEFFEISGLIGSSTKGELIRVSAFTGIGLFTGTERGKVGSTDPGTGWIDLNDPRNYETDPVLTVGIPMEAGIELIPFDPIGLGIFGFANLNLDKPMCGFIVKLELLKVK